MDNDVAVHGSSTIQRITRPTVGRFLATFGFAWLMIGLFTGTVVLVLLVRWLVNLLQHWGLGQTAQNRALIGLILLFIAGSFFLTRAVVRRLFRMESPRWRRITLAALVVPGGLSLWAWSNPTRVLASLAGSESSTLGTAGGPQFIFGSYPDENRLRELKRQGVTTIVSLQHPAVLVELQGIRAERDEAARLGLKFVQAPMLPWVSDNSDALATIRQIALSPSGKFYIHCGLGRDRVNIAKRVVEAVTDSTHGRVVASTGLQEALGFEARAETPFERGKLVNAGSGIWVVPFPNAAEMHGYILQGHAGHVFLLLDPRDTLQERWRSSAEQLLHEYVVPYTFISFAAGDSARAPAIAAQIRATPRPVTVIVPATSWGDPAEQVSSRAAGAILKALGAIPATATPRFVVPDSTLHERTIEMLQAARRSSPPTAEKRKTGRRR